MLTDTFQPLTRRVEEEPYFNSIEEFYSRLLRNKLVITQIDYTENMPQEKTIIQNTINLRSLVIKTVYKNREGKQLIYKKDCIWIDPRLS